MTLKDDHFSGFDPAKSGVTIKDFFEFLSQNTEYFRKIAYTSEFFKEELPRRVLFTRKVYSRLYRISKLVAKQGWAIPTTFDNYQFAELAINARRDGSRYQQAIEELFRKDPLAFERIVALAISTTSELKCSVLLRDSIDSFREQRWALASAGMFCVIESLYTTISKRGIKNIKKLISEFESEHLDDGSIMPATKAVQAMSISSTIYCIEKLYIDKYEYLGYSARNRLLHGHDIEHVNHTDCVRLMLCICNMASLRRAVHAMQSRKLDTAARGQLS